MKDYYRVLEVQCDSCENTIKRSYLRLAKKLHPDFNPSGQNQFMEVQEAYNILSDKKMKGYYDTNNNFYAKKADTKKEYEDARNEQFYS
jgi:DnaJ-class molecular chaperone